ncbi:MAG: polysaccharide deacetylase family protein [Pseudomonadota bacterium]|nr:polysaccharide deacetylase family protein [Pseudomonadota bacterium]
MSDQDPVASPSAERAIVLMYHRVGDSENDWERRYCVTPKRFAQHMHMLHSKGYRPCGIEQFAQWVGGTAALPSGSFLLTFDDGFEGVYEHARPVLLKLGWTASVFLVTQLIGQEDVWDELNNPSSRRHRLLDRMQIAEMVGEGFSFHSHSRHHLDLTTLSDAQLEEELLGSRRDIEDLLERPTPYLAYPFGRHDSRVQKAAHAAGYVAAFSTKPGFNRPGQERFSILRLDVAGTDSAGVLGRKMALGSNIGSIGAMARYTIGRVCHRLGLGYS